MPGYQLEETHFKLKFKGEQYDGLEVTVAEVSLGAMLDVAELADSVKAAKGIEAARPLAKLMKTLGDSLVSWNLEDRNKQPLPANEEGVRRQPTKFVLALVDAWVTSMVEVDIPLPTGSSDGETSLELSIPMEVSSPNHGSLPEQT